MSERNLLSIGVLAALLQPFLLPRAEPPDFRIRDTISNFVCAGNDVARLIRSGWRMGRLPRPRRFWRKFKALEFRPELVEHFLFRLVYPTWRSWLATRIGVGGRRAAAARQYDCRERASNAYLSGPQLDSLRYPMRWRPGDARPALLTRRPSLTM